MSSRTLRNMDCFGRSFIVCSSTSPPPSSGVSETDQLSLSGNEIVGPLACYLRHADGISFVQCSPPPLSLGHRFGLIAAGGLRSSASAFPKKRRPPCGFRLPHQDSRLTPLAKPERRILAVPRKRRTLPWEQPPSLFSAPRERGGKGEPHVLQQLNTHRLPRQQR